MLAVAELVPVVSRRPILWYRDVSPVTELFIFVGSKASTGTWVAVPNWPK